MFVCEQSVVFVHAAMLQRCAVMSLADELPTLKNVGGGVAPCHTWLSSSKSEFLSQHPAADHVKQEILEEFLRCELYHHCRALEVLAPALMHIEGVDAESARMVGGSWAPRPTQGYGLWGQL